MFESYIGTILTVGFDFAPKGWALCNGAILNISTNQALFALLGTTYGGDGRTTFALPDLRGRAAVHAGTGPSLSTYTEGELTGNETISISANQMPAHNHGASLPATAQNGSVDIPGGASPAVTVNPTAESYTLYGPHDASTVMPVNITVTGNGVGHENRQPSLVVNYIICTQGYFPPRG